MAEFRGSKNLHVGSPVWAESKYDHEKREYVITLDKADEVKKFRDVAEGYGFREVRAAKAAASDES